MDESELKQMPEEKLDLHFRKIDRQGFLHLLQDKGLLNSRDGLINIFGESQEIDGTYFLKKSVNEIKEQCFYTRSSYGVMSGPIIFKILDMKQRIKRFDGLNIETLRCPITIDDNIFKSEIAAPIVGQHNNKIIEAKIILKNLTIKISFKLN